jgi:hypothetical protein
MWCRVIMTIKVGRILVSSSFGRCFTIPRDGGWPTRGDDTTHPRALACASRLRSTLDAEAIHIVQTSDRSREPGEETEAGHSATPRPCGLTNGAM